MVSTTAVLMLGIGVGLTTAMFSVLRGVLIEPLPNRDEGRLVVVEKRTLEDGTLAPFAAADVIAFREQSRAVRAGCGVQHDGAWPGVLLVGVGSMFGTIGALAAGRALSALLFDVRSADPLVLGLTIALLAITGILACLLPSRRAARVDPVEAIRAD